MAGPMHIATINSSVILDKAGVSDIGLSCLLTSVTGFTLIKGTTSAIFRERGNLCSANDLYIKY